MCKLLYAGFDTLDIAIAGALPPNTIKVLQAAQDGAQESRDPVLVSIGPGKVSMHVSGHGVRGYSFLGDTGPLGAKWMISKNTDPTQWNFFVSPRSTMLLAYGYEGICKRLFTELEAMGAQVTNHSINRVDFAMDFQIQDFELHQDQFVAHSHTKVMSHWGAKDYQPERNKPATVLRGRRLESVTIGKMPGRQIIVYDKRREAIERQKYFWFEAWGLDRHDPTVKVWRVEVRAGKKELKDKYQIRSYEDFEASIGDVIINALEEVRYLADRQHDSNVTRQQLHALWIEAQSVAGTNLLVLRSGLCPGQVVKIERELALERYATLCIGNSIGLAVAQGYTDKEIRRKLPTLVADYAAAAIQKNGKRLAKSIQRTRAKLHFLEAPRG